MLQKRLCVCKMCVCEMRRWVTLKPWCFFVGGMASDRRALVGPALWLCTEGLQDAPWMGAPQVGGTPQPVLQKTRPWLLHPLNTG